MNLRIRDVAEAIATMTRCRIGTDEAEADLRKEIAQILTPSEQAIEEISSAGILVENLDATSNGEKP